MAGRKKIRRSKGKSRNLYFTAETQESLIIYQNSDVLEDQQKVYLEKIAPAFEKLVENLIFVYGFKTAYDSFDDLKTDCVSFLYESIHKWKPDRGTKAFSYFNVVAKNWLIIKSRQHTKRMKRHVSEDAPELMTASQKSAYES